MSLRGQEPTSESGYAMAALLVALAVMGVLMSVALPVWKHDARRAKEAELVWRGQQYVRAIRLYSAHMGGALPPSVDALVSGHYLRKAYKDPITNDNFQMLNAGAAMPGQPGGNNTAGSISQPPGSAFSAQTTVGGAIIGVVSKSKDESILVYQGRNHYNEWTFTYVNQRPTSAFPGSQPPQPGRAQPDGSGRGRGFPGRGRGFPGRGFGGRGFSTQGDGDLSPSPQIRRGGGGGL
jgi:type II secretory pathway pseudopilin PulG